MQGSARIDELRQKFHENPRRYFAPLANEYRKAGDPEQAIAICRAHLAQQPGHMSGHVVYAQSLYDAGRIDESRVVFEKALSLDPDNAIVLRQLGDISRQRGDSGEARHWYSRALEADPHDREIAAYIAELTEPLTETDAVPEVEAAPAPESAVAPAIETPLEEQPGELEPAEEEAAGEEAAEEEPVANELAADDAVAEPGSEATPLAWELADEARDGELDLATPATDVEVPLTAPGLEPEILAPSDEATIETDVTGAVTAPLTTASPFVTRTMADLYARQGYHQQALEVYRELAAASPDDAELADRVRELGAIAEAPATPDEPSSEVDTDTAPPETSSPVSEVVNEFGEPDDHESELGFRSQDETLAPTPDTDGGVGDNHFTETEIGAGDQWDTDPWGAGFSSDDEDVVTFDFSPSNASPEASEAFQLENPPDLGEATIPPVESHYESEESAEAVEPPAEQDVLAEAELAAAPLPLGVLNDAHEEFSVEEMFAVAASSAPDAEDAPGSQDDAVVAYSPQTPDEKDLVHYTPTGPTIREFFATLGAYRPPGLDAPQSFTARAAVPEMPAPAEPDESESDEIWSPAAPEPTADPTREPDLFPLASDAFASLFPDSPISEEDSKAAFALSGALSSQPALTPRATPPKPVAPTVSESPAPASGTQESEEDIRRFREWLDGLAES